MRYIKITRSDTEGSYIQAIDTLCDSLLAELDDLQYTDEGVSITLTVVEMSEDEYENLPEFSGW